MSDLLATDGRAGHRAPPPDVDEQVTGIEGPLRLEPRRVVARRVASLYWARARNRVREWRWWLRARAHLIITNLMVLTGACGALAGGWLIGRWCLGLVAIAESAGLIYVALMRDDGKTMPLRGARTVAEVLDDERIRE
jgi:hypothetical protein